MPKAILSYPRCAPRILQAEMHGPPPTSVRPAEQILNFCSKFHKQIERGFTLIELMVVVTMSLVIAGFAIPTYLRMQQSLRSGGDIRSLAGLIAEAKLRAAADFTHARVYGDLSANSYRLEVWNKAGNGGAGCWQTDGDVANPCTVGGQSPVQNLSTGVSFSLGNMSSPPANTQTSIGQAPICYTGAAGQPGNTTTIPNTACVEFNSRGVPSDPTGNGKADANGAFYVSDGSSVYGVTVLASGSIQSWYTPNTQTGTWQQR